MRDKQRARVYRWGWETKRILAEKKCLPQMSATDIDIFVRRISKDYNITPPKIRLTKRKGAASGGEGNIILPLSWACQKHTIIHEMCHCILFRNKEDGEGHGSRFVRLNIEMLINYTELTSSELLRLARIHRLDIAHINECPQRVKV